MTGEEYRQSLKNRRPLNVFLGGEKLEKPYDHPIIRASINSIALTYELAEDPEYKEHMTTRSALTGKTINRFCKQQAKYIISKLSNLIKEQEEFISSNQNKYNALFEINKDKLNSSIIDSLLKTVSTDCKITYNTRSSLFKEYLYIPSSIFFRFKRL